VRGSGKTNRPDRVVDHKPRSGTFVPMPRQHRILILVAFALSVLVRLPQLDRPLSYHHEYCTAIALTILHNWHEHGFLAMKGAPAITFMGPADRYPEDFIEGPGVQDGVVYYLSHPPLAYDLPYLLFATTGTAPSALGLQLFNILFHLVAAWCLYLALRHALSEAPGDAPLFAAVLYLFMPSTLWFHGNAYMSDMFVQNFWLMHVAVAVPVFTVPRAPTGRRLFLFGLTLFLAAYTSWPGVFAGAVSFGMALWLWRVRKHTHMPRVMAVTALAVLVAMLLTAWRYALVVDAENFLAYLRSRWEVRGSSEVLPEAGYLLRVLLENYRTGFLPLLGMLVALGIWHALRRSMPPLHKGALALLLVLVFLPVFLEHVFLLRYAHHDLAVLKGAPFLCILAAVLLAALPRRMAMAGLLLTVLAGALHFTRLNSPFLSERYYAVYRDMGRDIAAHVSPDQAVFCLGFTPEHQVMWYARRTLFRVDSMEQAREFLRAQGTAEGVVFRMEEGELLHERITALPGE
jgi:hypothetical protein